LVRENIVSGLHGVSRQDKRIKQYIVAEEDEDESEDAGDSRNFRGGAL
jgi:hypothetical protein